MNGRFAAALAAVALLGCAEKEAPLILYCAPSLRPAIEPIVANYQAQSGLGVALQYGPSGALETQIRLSSRGDLFLPASSEPYLSRMTAEGLVTRVLPLATMRLVVATHPDEEASIASIAELIESGVPFGLCNEQAAAGALARAALEPSGMWTRLEAKSVASLPTVTELAEAVRNGGRLRAAIVWDATARQFGLREIACPELAGAEAVVAVGVLSTARDPEAATRLAEHLASEGPRERLRVSLSQPAP